MRRAFPFLAVILLISACGEARPRRWGDPDGVPVQFVVELGADYTRNMSSPDRDPGWYEPWPYDPWLFRRPWGWGPGFAGPGWYGPGPVEVELLGGDGPVQAQVFRRELDRGLNRFQVPIRAGHQVTLTVQVIGGRKGWESVGVVTGSGRPGEEVELHLRAEGPTLSVRLPAEPPPAPPAQPPPAP